MNKQKILNELDKIFIGKGFMSCCHICPSCEKKMKKELFNLIKETKEKMAKALRMKEIKWQLEENYSDVIYESYNDAVEVLNKAIDNYLKVNKQ